MAHWEPQDLDKTVTRRRLIVDGECRAEVVLSMSDGYFWASVRGHTDVPYGLESQARHHCEEVCHVIC